MSQCLRIRYSMGSYKHGTEYIDPPYRPISDIAKRERYLTELQTSFPDMRIVDVSTVPVVRGTADAGHDVRTTFG